MVPRDERNHLDFVRLKASQVAVLDQVVRMPMMAREADEAADVVQHRRVLQPFAFAIREPVHRPRLIEQRECEPDHLLGVVRVVVAPLPELEKRQA